MNRLRGLLSFDIIPGNIVLKTFMSGALNLIWASLNDLSFLTLLSLISLTVPGLAHSLQQVVLKLLFLDVLLTDQWLLPWIEEIQY